MSQSDYIKYKRLANELKNQEENLKPVIDSGKYIGYKSFTLENTIMNTKQTFTKLQPASSVNVFGMQINNPSSCANFQLCSGTNSRPNRRPLLETQSIARPLYFPKKDPNKKKTADKLNICNYC